MRLLVIVPPCSALFAYEGLAVGLCCAAPYAVKFAFACQVERFLCAGSGDGTCFAQFVGFGSL